MEELKAAGIKSVINIRTNPTKKVRKLAEELGIKYFQVKTGVFQLPGEDEIESFLEIVGNPDNQPIYVYCKGGRDRTVFYIALYRMAIEGWSSEQAAKEFKVHKLRRGWPLFWYYDDVLTKYSARIAELSRKNHLMHITTKAGGMGCPCHRVQFAEIDAGKQI